MELKKEQDLKDEKGNRIDLTAVSKQNQPRIPIDLFDKYFNVPTKKDGYRGPIAVDFYTGKLFDVLCNHQDGNSDKALVSVTLLDSIYYVGDIYVYENKVYKIKNHCQFTELSDDEKELYKNQENGIPLLIYQEHFNEVGRYAVHKKAGVVYWKEYNKSSSNSLYGKNFDSIVLCRIVEPNEFEEKHIKIVQKFVEKRNGERSYEYVQCLD